MSDKSAGQRYGVVLGILFLILLVSLPGLTASNDAPGPVTQTSHSNTYPWTEVHAQLLDTEIAGEEPIQVDVRLERGRDYGDDPITEPDTLNVYLFIGGDRSMPEFLFVKKKVVALAPGGTKMVTFEVPLDEEVYDRGLSKSKVPVRVYVTPNIHTPDTWTVLESHYTHELGDLSVRPSLFDRWQFWGMVLSCLGIGVTLYQSREFHSRWKRSFIKGVKAVHNEMEAASTASRRGSWSVRSLVTDYSPYEFERVIARLYRAKGYYVKRTSKSGDAGLDVLARKDGKYVGIQVKRYSPGNNVGSPEVQNAVGAAIQQGCNEVVVVTTSDFTGPAKSAARATSRNGIIVILVNGGILVRKLNRHL